MLFNGVWYEMDDNDVNYDNPDKLDLSDFFGNLDEGDIPETDDEMYELLDSGIEL